MDKNKCVENGLVIHRCGKPRMYKFHNLRKAYPKIKGKTIPVKIRIYPCQEVSCAEAGRRGKEAGKKFKELNKI